MKLFCHIFSLYFLALSMMPCTDIHDVNTSESNELARISTHNHSCPHDDDQDTCSPFCACACCGMTINIDILDVYIYFSKRIETPIFIPIFTYQNAHSNQYLQGVFQPPRIG